LKKREQISQKTKKKKFFYKTFFAMKANLQQKLLF